MFIRRCALLLAGSLAVPAALWAEPVTLETALEQGRSASPRLVKADAEAKAAEARAQQAGVRPNPSIGLDVENFSGTGPYKTFGRTETTVAVSQMFELGGKRNARKAVALAELDYARLGVRLADADLEYDIRTAHATLRAAEDRALLARDNLARAKELSRIATTLVEVGRDPPLRKMRADAMLAEAEAASLKAFGDMLSARRKWMMLTGSADTEPSAIPEGAFTVPLLPEGTPSIEEKLSTAQLDASRARVTLAQAQAVPDITASGGFRRFEETGQTAVIAGISIPLPFWDRNKGNISAAQSETVAADAALAQSRLLASFTQRDAKLMLDAAEARLDALKESGLREAEEAARVADVGYRNGKFSLVELIDAQEALTRTKLNIIEAELDRANARAMLVRATAQ